MGLAARTPREASETASVEEETEAEPTAAAENDPASSEATEMRPQRVAVRSTPSTPPAARPSPSIVESPKPEKQVAAVTEKPEPRKESPAVAKVENEKPKPEAATVAEAPAPPEPPVEAMPDNKKDTPVEAPVRTKPQPEKIAEAKPEPAPKPDKSFQNYFSLHTGPTTEGSSPQDRGTREPENPQRPRRLQVEPSESLLVENGKPGSRKSENPREGFSNYFSLFTSPESDDEEGMADASPSQD